MTELAATADFTVHGQDVNELLDRAHAIAAHLAGGRPYRLTTLHAPPAVSLANGEVHTWEGDCHVEVTR